MQKQSFSISPNGLIKGGAFHYQFDETTGVIDFQTDIEVGWLFFKKTISKDGSYKVDPNLLLSKKVLLGEKVVLGNVDILVMNINANKARLSVNVDGTQITGGATVDVSQQYAKVDSVYAKGSVAGMSFTLQMNAIP